jgi:ankyrin repeat protein
MHFSLKSCKRLQLRTARPIMILALAVLCAATAFSDDIQEAARSGDLRKVKEILAADPKAISVQDKDGDTALHQAALHGQYAVAAFLISAGANVNAKNSYPPFLPNDLNQEFMTANHQDPVILLSSQAASSLSQLSTQGMTEKQVKGGGYTPLGLAEFAENHNKMIQLLIAHGADVNAQGSSGATPLFWAVMRDEKDDVKFLLDHGANPNLADVYKDTPLICAVQLGFESLVEPLVDKGADVNAIDESPSRALTYAKQKDEDTAESILKKHGAHE